MNVGSTFFLFFISCFVLFGVSKQSYLILTYLGYGLSFAIGG